MRLSRNHPSRSDLSLRTDPDQRMSFPLTSFEKKLIFLDEETDSIWIHLDRGHSLFFRYARFRTISFFLV